MGRAGPRRVRSYSPEFKVKAVSLSGLDGRILRTRRKRASRIATDAHSHSPGIRGDRGSRLHRPRLTPCRECCRPSGRHRYPLRQERLVRDLPAQIIPLPDRILLLLLVVELLYTVQVSFRQHAVTPEPFLLVGLIAAIRRVLILTAEFGQATGQAAPTQLVPELAVLSALLMAIALSLFVLRRKDTTDKVAKP